ncbi:MAG: helix-turn-helix domain-containing protein, partial [Myxococcota bacterium]
IMALQAEIDIADLPSTLLDTSAHAASVLQAPAGAAEGSVAPGPSSGDLRAQLRAFESRLILDALAICAYNKTRAAEHLGIPIRTLSHKIQSLGLKSQLPPRKS